MEERTNKPAGFNANIFTGLGNPLLVPFPKVLRGGSEEVNTPAEFTPPPAHLLGNPMYFRLKLDDVWLPNEPLITLSGSKVIVKTPIAGGNGTVKEMIGEDDYKISIKGRAVREVAERYRDAGGLVPDDYPEEWMRTLARLWKINKDVSCQCQLLSYFNITRCVIEDITFPPVPGESGSFYYEINAVSDESSVAKLIRK
jgi:hypothetical protein